MKTLCVLGCPVLFLVLANVSAGGGEDKIKTVGRAPLAQHKDAVISVTFAGFVEVKDGDAVQKNEFNGAAMGTVVSPNGLTVMCLASMKLGAEGLILVEGANKDGEAKPKKEFTEIVMILADGRKIPARTVLKDENAGVMYVAPKEKQTKLKYVALEKRNMPEVLDQVIFLGRLRENLDRQVEIGIGRVTAVRKKPYPALVTDINLDGGCAIFDAAGRPVGIGVLRDDGKTTLSSIRLVVLPAEALQVSKLAEALSRSEKDEK